MIAMLNNVTKKYGKNVAIRNATLEVEEGKVYGLLGPNGSGKSTTLKLLSGLVFPDTGSVIVNGCTVTRKISGMVAYLTDLDVYYEQFTLDNMIHYYESQFADFDRQKAEHLLHEWNLDEKQKLKYMSKGNRARAKLMLALARKAKLLLLDEPFSGLDPLVRESIVKSIVSHLDFGSQTVIIATHEIDEIEPLLDDVMIMNDGEFVGKENVERLREEEGMSVRQWFKHVMKQVR